jgi:hypothetical protein
MSRSADFTLLMRLYSPRPQVVSGERVSPPVKQIK